MDALPQLQELASQANSLAAELKALEAEAKDKQASINEILSVRMPEVMAGAGMGIGDKVSVDGQSYALQEYVSGTWPKDEEAATRAQMLLDEYGASSLIKSSVQLDFGRDEVGRAGAVAEEFRNSGVPVKFSVGVHPQTLRAFARERLKNGEPTDLATLGLDSGLIVKVSGDG